MRGESYRVGRIIEEAILSKDGSALKPLYSEEVSGRKVGLSGIIIVNDTVSVDSAGERPGGKVTIGK